MKTPVLVINYKNYRQGYGESGIRIAEYAKKISERYDVEIIVMPPFTEIRNILKVGVLVYAQHADPLGYGANTGSIPLEALKDIGVKGVLVNHSEKRVDLRHIAKVIELSKKLGLETLVCAEDVYIAKMVALLEPDAIALEPPELIGSGKAVSKVKPEIITEGVQAVKSINNRVKVLAGAGITSYEDVAKAIELGSEGVLVASAIMTAEKPEKVIEDMVKALKNNT
ncbi:MAG: triose-phosphate isomerase [Sulfolobales archaeon]